MLRLTRPTSAELARVLAAQRGEDLAYPGVGATLGGRQPAGYRHDRYEAHLGCGEETWDRAAAALKEWGPQRGSGLTVVADNAIATGTNVVLVAPLPVGVAVAACRVVGLVEDRHAWGFAYGTLPTHPEEGEECFVVRRRDGVVTFEITAFSRPRHPFARLAGPIARGLQVRATRRYLAAMQAAVR